jgi:hypothetical protein
VAIITGADLAAHLGGAADATLCDLCAAAGSAAVEAIVDPLDPDDPTAVWADEIRLVALDVATEQYKAAAAPGGFQMDQFTTADFRLSGAQLRKYEPVLAKHRAVGGMVG